MKSGAPGTEDGQTSFYGVRLEGPCLGPWGLHPSTWDPVQDWGHSTRSRTCVQVLQHVAAPGGAVLYQEQASSRPFKPAQWCRWRRGRDFAPRTGKEKKISSYQALTSCLVGTVNLLCIIRI